MTAKKITLTPGEALEYVRRNAPALAEAAFLDQLYERLRSGLITASAYANKIVEASYDGIADPIIGTAPQDPANPNRRDIPAIEWRDLAIDMASASARLWGHDRSPARFREADWRGYPAYEDGDIHGLPVYDEVLLTGEAAKFNFDDETPAEETVAHRKATTAEILSLLREIEARTGVRPNTRTWKRENLATKNVRKDDCLRILKKYWPDRSVGRPEK
jgi:hypothetical protein